ncbi:unnamed protein product [Eretmochelys imbricata]
MHEEGEGQQVPCVWGAGVGKRPGLVDGSEERADVCLPDAPSLSQISERYGPIHTLHLGPRGVVMLCGYQAVKEALLDQAEEFSGRGEQAAFSRLFEGYGQSRAREGSEPGVGAQRGQLPAGAAWARC